MKISRKIWKCHKIQQNLFWLSRGSMLIFTTFQQQKKKVTRCLSFLGRFFFWSNFTIDLAEEANMFRRRKNALMGSKSEISVKFSSCSDIKNRLDGNYIYGDGSKPWYLLFTPNHSWVKMDVHPTIVMVSIAIDPYPYIRNIRLIGVNFWFLSMVIWRIYG